MQRDLNPNVVPADQVGEKGTTVTAETGNAEADDTARKLDLISQMTGMSEDELLEALEIYATAQPADSEPELPAGGYFAEIAFMGRIEYTGYVTQITKNGQPAYHIDLPDRLWGTNPLAWVEHAASAWFSERPVSEESVRKSWQAAVAARARRARQEAEWHRMQAERALEAASADDADDEDGEDLDDEDARF